MSKLLIGIISYLPSDEKLTEIRLKNHLKQVKELKDLLGNDCDIFGVYQKYTEDNLTELRPYLSDYLRFDEGIGPSGARNEVLKYWYDSAYSNLLILDDDTGIYNYYGIKDFLINSLDKINDISFSKVGMIKAINPMFTPFKEYNCKNQLTIEHNFTLQESVNNMINTGGFYLLLSPVKEYKPLFRHTNFKLGEGNEDFDFHTNLTVHKLAVYKCLQMIQKNYAVDVSVLFSGNEERMSLHIKNVTAVYNYWKELGYNLELIGNGTKINALPAIGNLDKFVTIPRNVKYELEDNLIYKPRKQKKEEKIHTNIEEIDLF